MLGVSCACIHSLHVTVFYVAVNITAASTVSLHSVSQSFFLYFPTGGSDYITSTVTFSFPNPSPADTMQCGSVPIMGDTIVEPCEAFYLNLTSSAERSRIVDDLPNTVIIYDDEGTVNFRLHAY